MEVRPVHVTFIVFTDTVQSEKLLYNIPREKDDIEFFEGLFSVQRVRWIFNDQNYLNGRVVIYIQKH